MEDKKLGNIQFFKILKKLEVKMKNPALQAKIGA